VTARAGPLASAPRERARESLADNSIRCLHAHWCLCVPQLTLADAVRARRAVDALAGPDAVPAAGSLRALFDRHGLHDLADALERWLDGHADYEVAR